MYLKLQIVLSPYLTDFFINLKMRNCLNYVLQLSEPGVLEFVDQSYTRQNYNRYKGDKDLLKIAQLSVFDFFFSIFCCESSDANGSYIHGISLFLYYLKRTASNSKIATKAHTEKWISSLVYHDIDNIQISKTRKIAEIQ